MILCFTSPNNICKSWLQCSHFKYTKIPQLNFYNSVIFCFMCIAFWDSGLKLLYKPKLNISISLHKPNHLGFEKVKKKLHKWASLSCRLQNNCFSLSKCSLYPGLMVHFLHWSWDGKNIVKCCVNDLPLAIMKHFQGAYNHYQFVGKFELEKDLITPIFEPGVGQR